MVSSVPFVIGMLRRFGVTGQGIGIRNGGVDQFAELFVGEVVAIVVDGIAAGIVPCDVSHAPFAVDEMQVPDMGEGVIAF